MNEQIYTIPVNEAFDADCECPLCYLEKKLEDESVEYSLGAAMMEPDYRIKSNAMGFCNRHFSQMTELPNKLSLALVLDTHLEEVRQKLHKDIKSISEASEKKGRLFGKRNSSSAERLHEINSSCIICEQINHTMERYIRVIFFMWCKDDEFKQKFINSKGFCLKHFEQLLNLSSKHLNGKNLRSFLELLTSKEEEELLKLQEDIHKFTLKFDYRNRDMELGNAEQAPLRAVEKISGFLHTREKNSR